MSRRISISHAAALLVLSLTFASTANPVGAQVTPPQKKAAVDTLKREAAPRQQGRTKIVKQHVAKPTRKESAGGDVALLKGGIDEDSLNNAIDAVRQEEFSRAQQQLRRQRLLDSAYAAMEFRRALKAERAAGAMALERQRAEAAALAAAREQDRALALQRHLARGFYVGAAAGMSAPQGDIRDGYTGGWNVTIPLGWDADAGPYGFRVDYTVDHLGGTSLRDPSGNVVASSDAITVWSLNADVKLRAHAPGTPTRSHVYVLGGIGEHRVTDGVYGTSGPHAGRSLSFGNAKTRFGWNAGVGVAMEWGPTELFVESRFFQVKSDLTYHASGGVGRYTSFTPIVVGLDWF